MGENERRQARMIAHEFVRIIKEEIGGSILGKLLWVVIVAVVLAYVWLGGHLE